MDEKKAKALEKKLAKGPGKKAKAQNKRIGGLSLHKRAASSTRSYGAGFPAVHPVGVSPLPSGTPERTKGIGGKSQLHVKKKSGSVTSGGGVTQSPSVTSRRLSLSAKFKSGVSKKKKSNGDLEESLDVSTLQLLRDQRVKVFAVELSTLLDRERDALGLLARTRGEGALVSDSRVPSEFKSGQRRHCIPFIVRQTATYLRDTGGIKQAGLFRLCGKFSDMTAVQEAVDDGMALSEEDLAKLDTHTVGDLFKTFLRLLPHSIIPRVFFDHYMASTAVFEDATERLAFLASLTLALPADNWELVKFLCEFFSEVAANSSTNQMGTANLAIIFAPALFGDSNSNDQQAVLREVKMTAAVTSTLIDNYEDVFMSAAEPAAVMVAKESHNGEHFSFFKGEQLVVSMKEDSDDEMLPVALVGGRLVRNVPRSVIEKKCTPHEIMFATRSYDMPSGRDESNSGHLKAWEASTPIPTRAATVAVGPGAAQVARAVSSTPSSPTLSARTRCLSPVLPRKTPTPPPRGGTTPNPLRHRSKSFESKGSAKLSRKGSKSPKRIDY